MDTIVAIATPQGRSAIGVVRLTGASALPILRDLVSDPDFRPYPNHVTLKRLLNASSDVIDYALVSFFAAPNSYTGEDMVEISCHGSPLILRQLLDEVQRLDARLAEPGEFTLRALRHGKINLSQAEAIRDLIDAKTTAAAKQATRQLRGELSTALQPAKDELIKVIVLLESALEFVEDDLPGVQKQAAMDQLVHVRQILQQLAATYEAGHLLRDGIRVALIGRPNVGKSSLFNQLVKHDRAIVTEVPGTTRDTLNEQININGVAVQLTDTAGIRDATDRIEAIGVERSHRAVADADLLVVVIDGATKLHDEDRSILDLAMDQRHVVAINKSDLEQVDNDLNGRKVVHVSALTGAGLRELSTAILEPFGTVDSDAVGLLVTDSRHHDLLLRAASALDEAHALVEQSASEELVLVGLHNALRFLGDITGETTTEEILGQIFSTFCIGK